MISWLGQFVQQEVLTCSFYGCLLFVMTAFLYHLCIFLRFKIKINAECWFCMKKTRICLASRNSWTCGHVDCSQYNGFTKNGSYNRVIEEQHGDNQVRYCKPHPLAKYEQHRLCDACNKNQEMQIKMLADFVPLNEANFDREVIEFRKHLESVYRICDLCELLIEKVLEKPSNFNFPRSPQKPPTLNSTAIYSSVTDVSQSSKERRYFTSLIWPTITYLGIIAILIYLFGLSNHSFIEPFTKPAKYNYYFKKNFSVEHTKLYEQHYFLAVMTASALYTLLVYSGKTCYLSVDSIIFSLFSMLVTNSFNYRLFTLTHDALVEFHQLLFAFLTLALLFNTVSFLYWNFEWQSNTRNFGETRAFQSNKNSAATRGNTPKKTFNFTKFEDGTTNIREQIKDLCLTDFNSNIGNGMKTAFSDMSPSGQTPLNPFSSYCLTPSRSSSPFADDTFKSPRNFSYFQYEFSKASSMFGSNMLSPPHFFGKSPSPNSFQSKGGQFIALTGQAAYLSNSGQFSANQLANLSGKTQPQYGSGSPRILNYYVNYEQRPFEKSTHASPATLHVSNWLSHMLRTFELTLFLVIIGLIVVLLSMPITLSYNSDFNSFDFSIVVHNLTST